MPYRPLAAALLPAAAGSDPIPARFAAEGADRAALAAMLTSCVRPVSIKDRVLSDA